MSRYIWRDRNTCSSWTWSLRLAILLLAGALPGKAQVFSESDVHHTPPYALGSQATFMDWKYGASGASNVTFYLSWVGASGLAQYITLHEYNRSDVTGHTFYTGAYDSPNIPGAYGSSSYTGFAGTLALSAGLHDVQIALFGPQGQSVSTVSEWLWVDYSHEVTASGNFPGICGDSTNVTGSGGQQGSGPYEDSEGNPATPGKWYIYAAPGGDTTGVTAGFGSGAPDSGGSTTGSTTTGTTTGSIPLPPGSSDFWTNLGTWLQGLFVMDNTHLTNLQGMLSGWRTCGPWGSVSTLQNSYANYQTGQPSVDGPEVNPNTAGFTYSGPAYGDGSPGVSGTVSMATVLASVSSGNPGGGGAADNYSPWRYATSTEDWRHVFRTLIEIILWAMVGAGLLLWLRGRLSV